MNMNELRQALGLIAYDTNLVGFGGIADDMWCIMPSAGSGWEVFYYERGNKNKLVELPSEDTACLYLFGQLAFDQVMDQRIVVAQG